MICAIFFAYLSIVKQIITYSLLVLVVFAFNYEAVRYLLDHDSKIVCSLDDCEEEKKESEKSESEKTESEKSDEKSEKKSLSEYLFQKHNSLFILNVQAFNYKDNFLFIPSDYRKAVYMPPEQISQA